MTAPSPEGAAQRPEAVYLPLDEMAWEPAAAADPAEVDPIAADPVAGDPVAIDPVAIDPVAIDPVAIDPVAIDPVAGDPAEADPAGAAVTEEAGAPPELPAEAHSLAVTRTARYFTLGASGGDVRELWYVLHGYGQLAAAFIRPFGALAGPHRQVVAPEALSRFYLDPQHARVGASWMTREDRLHEIADNLAYLNALHAGLLAGGVGADVPVHVLGFSQGTETAARWVAFGDVRPARLILWGGRLPADLDLSTHRAAFCRLRLTLVRGDADEVATPERATEEEARLNRHTIPYEALTFEGGHRLSTDVLRELAAG